MHDRRNAVIPGRVVYPPPRMRSQVHLAHTRKSHASRTGMSASPMLQSHTTRAGLPAPCMVKVEDSVKTPSRTLRPGQSGGWHTATACPYTAKSSFSDAAAPDIGFSTMLLSLRKILLLLAVALLGGWAGAGCQNPKPSSTGDFAAVVITNRTVDEIREATVGTFLENGYQVPLALGKDMLFEKEGDLMKQLVFGDFVPDQNVWVRVPVKIVSLGPTRHRLECKAFMVRHKGDSILEEEVRMSRMRRKPFQEMLDAVAKRLL